MRSIQSLVFRPFAVLYDLVTSLRNLAFDKGWLRSFEYTLPVISVGNLKVGGTGKTPMVEYITRAIIKFDRKPAIISRGYKRKTKGFLIANENASPKLIGDEPYQYYQKWHEEVVVAVGEDRALAIPQVLYDKPDVDYIVLDDAYQHRRVQPGFNIMLTEFGRPFYRDHILPAGLLRESRRGAGRAQAIVVTKCPYQVTVRAKNEIREEIKQYAPNVPVYFTTVKYGVPLSLWDNSETTLDQSIVLVTGIANASPLIDYLKDKVSIAKHLEYSDHYDYNDKDVQSIKKTLGEARDSMLVTTEKDAVKLNAYKAELKEHSCLYIPIEISFLEGEEDFSQQLEKTITDVD